MYIHHAYTIDEDWRAPDVVRYRRLLDEHGVDY